MSYQEKTITVSLMSTFLLFGFYLINVFQLYQQGNFNSTKVFSLWATIIVLAIIVGITANIITQIVFAVIHAIKTNEEEKFVADERDKLIGLKGTRNSHHVLSVGIFVSLGALVFNVPPLVMFNMLIFSAMLASIIGDVSQLYFYRRGV